MRARLSIPAAACVLVHAGALGAPAVEEPIDEITVVATRRSTDVEDVSMGVAAIDGRAAIENKLVTDALAEQIGVSLQQTTPGQGAAIVRGLKGSAILHLVDGMRLSNALFRTAPTPWFALVPTTSVEHIEVIRGTPASLYGSEAVGGVIQSVSRFPEFDTDELSYAGDLVLGFDSAELQRSLRGTIDAGTRELAASLGAEYLETGNRRTGSGNRIGPSGYSSKAVRAVVHGRPSDKRSWFVDLHYLEQPGTPRIDELVPGFGQTEPSSAEFLFAPNTRTFAHLQHDHLAPSGIDWRVDAAWQRIDDDRTTRDFGADERRFEENRSDLYGVSVNASRERPGFNWIAGLDLYHDRVRSVRVAQSLSDLSVTTLAPRFPSGSTISQGGLFARVEWLHGTRHRLSAGLRYSDVRIDLPDGTRIEPAKLSGDAGWVFDLADHWQIVANAGRGFRAPNIADLGTLGNRPGNRFNIPNSALGAEMVNHVDAGVRFSRSGWRAEVVAWQLSYTDRIVSVNTGGTTPDGRDIVQSINAASARLHGLEAGVHVALADNVRARSVLNYTHGTQRVGSSEEPADRIPPLSGHLAVSFDIHEAWQIEGTFSAAARQDRLSDRDVIDVRIDPTGTPGWSRLDVEAQWTAGDGWQVTAGIANLLDRRYRVHGSGIDAPGRNLFATIRRHW